VAANQNKCRIFKVGALLLHQFQRTRPQHFEGLDVNVAVSDQNSS
jgi:hypothetical protein